ncbi:MAG: hypothetical protein EXS63_04310 [Candidatus Omnitrophica bacterium]|nr:hypothetical protein [Candidatus Omnitrophota bacterium]
MERVGEIFLRKKIVTHEQLEAALQDQVHTGEFLGEILIRMGYVKEEDLLRVLAEQFNTRFVELKDVRINPVVINMVPRNIVMEYKLIPIEMRSGLMLIAMSNPLDIWPTSVLQEKLNLDEVQFVLATKNDIMGHINKYYS